VNPDFQMGIGCEINHEDENAQNRHKANAIKMAWKLLRIILKYKNLISRVKGMYLVNDPLNYAFFVIYKTYVTAW